MILVFLEYSGVHVLINEKQIFMSEKMSKKVNSSSSFSPK